MTQEDILIIILEDLWMMDALKVVRYLNLPDWWIGAGFVRNKIWDYLHEFDSRTETDVDVIYFDPSDINESTEKQIDQKLKNLLPYIPWSTKNMARMHLVNGDLPYQSSVDCFSRWPETATCVAVKLDSAGDLILKAPHGIDDIINLRIRINPVYPRPEAFKERLVKKNWPQRWPKLTVIN